MKRIFKPLATYIKLHDGFGKPKLDFQTMYKLFPDLTFTASRNFGRYSNWDQAFCKKNYDMQVTSPEGHVCYITYAEYQDVDENLAGVWS